MKQIAQNYRTGELTLVEAPVPRCAPRGLLVRTEYSLISAGTELMKVGEAKLSLMGKARARPDQVRKVMESVAQQGPQATFKKVMNRLDSYTPLGYSLCGRVLEVGEGVDGYAVGDRVVCAGAKHALHAEVNWVPINLSAAVPEGVDPRHAAFTTVGAIAMHGVRQSGVTLGETAVVIGLGLVGQLIVQLLGAAGCRVIGIDLSPDRCALAENLGALAAGPAEGDGLDRVLLALEAATGGAGADAVILAAASSSNGPVELAPRLARDRARVVDVGKTGLDLPYDAYFEKELEVRFSRSYGPGRYDPTYEDDGVDYPIGYVRWTEGRNLSAFVDLLARHRLDLEPLISKVVAFDDAVTTYEQLDAGDLHGIGFLFEYPAEPDLTRTIVRARPAPASSGRSAPLPAIGPVLRIGFVGAGNYTSTMLLPHLAGRPDLALVKVATSSSLSSLTAQKKFGFEEAGTDASSVVEDPSLDAVFIVTPHSSHARLTATALRAGRAVFVEKPLAIDLEGLAEVDAAVEESGNRRLHVGFNRRFAPLLVETRQRFGTASPSMLRYLVNAGRSGGGGGWQARSALEGSRFNGEAGHFLDVMTWWAGADPVAVTAHTMSGRPDDVEVVVELADGSIGTLTYTTLGHAKFPKETFEAIGGGANARFDNFRKAAVWRGRRVRKQRALSPDKGQKAQVEAFCAAVRTGQPMPIPYSTLRAVTRATILAATDTSGTRQVV